MPKWQLMGNKSWPQHSAECFHGLTTLPVSVPLSLSLIHFEIYVEGASKIELRSVARQKWAWPKTCTLVWGLDNLIVLLWLLLCAACRIWEHNSPNLVPIRTTLTWNSLFDLLRKRLLFSRITSERAVDDFSLTVYLPSELNHRCLGENSRAQFETGRISFVRQ